MKCWTICAAFGLVARLPASTCGGRTCSLGLDGTSVYEAGFGAEQISIATPSIGWSRSNIGLGNGLCGEKGAEAYCYYANISVSLRESLADVETQTSTQALIETTIGWRPPLKNFSVSATGSVQDVAFADYPGGMSC